MLKPGLMKRGINRGSIVDLFEFFDKWTVPGLDEPGLE